MIRPCLFGVAVGMIASSMGAAIAATWQLISVAQPVQTETMIEIRDVLFGFDKFTFGSEVEFTCRRNSIRIIGEEFDVHTQNLNLASRYGLSLTVDYLNAVSAEASDTLVVRLDASRIEKSVSRDVSADSVVAATITCMRINAARTPKLDYLRIRIHGPKRLQAMGGTFPVSDVPQRRAFEFGPVGN